MGLFDIFAKNKGPEAPKNKTEKEVVRLERLVQNKMSQNYDRQEALDQLCAMGTARSAEALLKRFNWTMDPSITDQEEKSQAVQGIVTAGEAAIAPIRAYCKKAESLVWPLKALRQILDEESFVDELLSILDQFDTEYTRNVEPKVQLITTLEEFVSEDVRVAVEPFLTDMSEPVRFVAATTVFAMNNPVSVPALVAALEEEESLRVKNRICSALAERDWKIPKELAETCEESLPEDYVLSGDQVRPASA